MKDFHNKTTSDLHRILFEKREAVRKFRFDVAGSKIKNVKEAQTLRRDIARILTILNTKKEA